MLRLKAIRLKKRNVVWLIPLLILGTGAFPDILDSGWWNALGIILFLIIIFVCGWDWFRVVQEQREREQM
ncbi:hypothetical protein GC098_27265 [Paenibacillus sp. LMG 31458]|uniref:Uncharacterized protein n=1 Tax=Paenibacillus phytorum TaxID=2654977 RepID=A0ABX1Y2E4_9BACL|nr:hypothetical protein [Paenibacillus phytorum]NOU75042.1 hypothetical protein [Paenibacillus phytorum]